VAVYTPEHLLELVGLGLAPGCMLVLGSGLAFWAAPMTPLDSSLQAAGFLEPAMTTLLHQATPLSNRPGQGGAPGARPIPG
jgi:hypothetical protein